jgi:hypothetical protein
MPVAARPRPSVRVGDCRRVSAFGALRRRLALVYACERMGRMSVRMLRAEMIGRGRKTV